jgi:hypothetical protein
MFDLCMKLRENGGFKVRLFSQIQTNFIMKLVMVPRVPWRSLRVPLQVFRLVWKIWGLATIHGEPPEANLRQ